MGGSLSLFRADWMRGRVQSTQQTLAHGVEATIHSVNIYWAFATCRFCSSHGGSATKGRSKRPLLTFTCPCQDFSRALKNPRKWNKGHDFQIPSWDASRTAFSSESEPAAMRPELQGTEAMGLRVAWAVHLGNQMQTVGATSTLAFRIWAEIEFRRHRLLSLLCFALKMRKVT